MANNLPYTDIESPEMMLAVHQAERARRAERPQTEEFLQMKAVFALEDMAIKDAEMKYGWQGGASPNSASDPELCFVASREIGANRELVVYQVEASPGYYHVHFEIYVVDGEPVEIPGTDPDFPVTVVMMSAPDVHGWG